MVQFLNKLDSYSCSQIFYIPYSVTYMIPPQEPIFHVFVRPRVLTI